jgi:hypothetical protein
MATQKIRRSATMLKKLMNRQLIADWLSTIASSGTVFKSVRYCR